MRLTLLWMAFIGATLLGVATAKMTGRELDGDEKGAQIVAAARKAIAGGKLDALKTMTLQAKVQRNVGNFQMTSDIEVFLEMPDKYARAEVASGGPVNVSATTGFNGTRPIARNPNGATGGHLVIRMGPGGQVTHGETPTPEQQEQMKKASVRAATHELSRLMLGWFAVAHPTVAATYTFVAEAEAPEGKADVIEVKDADGFSATLFIDQLTRLPLMVTYRGPQRRVVTMSGPKPAAGGADRHLEAARAEAPQMVEYTLFFGQWREVDGVKFPHVVQRATGGTTEEEWIVDRVKLNPKIDPKTFDVQG